MLKVIPPATYHWSVDPYFGHSVKIPVGILQRVDTGFVGISSLFDLRYTPRYPSGCQLASPKLLVKIFGLTTCVGVSRNNKLGGDNAG
jgi:hypothetical protein